MLKSNTSIFDDIIVIDIDIEDLYIQNYYFEFSKLISENEILKVVFNFENIDVLTSSDIQSVQKIVDTLHLNGVKSIVCGINPYSASLIYTFIDKIKFTTTLDVKGAIDAFSIK
ncbi:hypothetical protein [Arcobacter sp. YIC-310]|uniref:hypothetical protein n=1 Tax=Arcobacter sp. YIC-310 TaxID=3376632 RepID=UPI003C139941